MSEEENETKLNEESRSEEREYSEGKEYEQESQDNTNKKVEADADKNEAFKRAQTAYDAKLKLQGEILGGQEKREFNPEKARNLFNLLSTSEIDAPSALSISKSNIDGSSISLDLVNLPDDLENQLKGILNVDNDDVADAIANTLKNLKNPSERLQYLSEANHDFNIEGTYSEYDPIKGQDLNTKFDSKAKYAREVIKNSRSLIEGKIAKFGNVSEIEIKGAKYKVEGNVILKDGEPFFDFTSLKDTMDNLSAETERLEQMESDGSTAAQIETQRGVVAEERSKFFDGITLKGLGKGLVGIVALVFGITQVIALEHLLGTLVNDKKKEISGCYLISSDVSDNLHDPKNTNCVSCASSTFKVSSCEDTACCTPFKATESPSLPNGFKATENGPSYWNIGSGNVICNGNINHPSYLSIDKCNTKDKPQLGADAVAEFLKRGINVPSTPLPLALWTQDGSVTYAIRSISSSDALVEVACDLEKALCNVGSGVGKLFLKIALPILIVCGLFYFIKFEYDKHDGKVKAKYRK